MSWQRQKSSILSGGVLLFKVSRRDTCDRYYIFSLFGFALFVHRIHHDEEEGIYHNHPWNGISLILGSYMEQRFGEPLKKRWGLRWVPAKTHHRVEGSVWTIFFHFRRSNQWTVIDETGRVLATEP